MSSAEAKVKQIFDADFQAQLEQEQAKWEAQTVKPSLKSKPEFKEGFTTRSGEFTVKRLYSPLDVADWIISMRLASLDNILSLGE